MSALYIAVVMFCFACAATKSLISLPTESGELEEAEKTEGAEEAEATWGDDFAWSDRTYMACIADRASSFCDELWSTRDQVESVVNSTLKKEQIFYIRGRIDNLVFIEVFTPCLLFDDCGKRHWAAVILGKKPRIVEMPNEALFVHFMKTIRKTPNALALETKIPTTLILLTGNDNFIISLIKDPDPKPCPTEFCLEGGRDEYMLANTTWTDKDGILIIQYRTSDNWWDYECRLRVDAEQRAMRRCVSINREPECFMEHFFVPNKETRRGCDNGADIPAELWVDESRHGFLDSVSPEPYHL
ncbi:MAG: hypothetical protein FWC40_09505 [Proteobacteria bacterium]|nr:hypothetical protein [Pseudomonadota bacterium]